MALLNIQFDGRGQPFKIENGRQVFLRPVDAAGLAGMWIPEGPEKDALNAERGITPEVAQRLLTYATNMGVTLSNPSGGPASRYSSFMRSGSTFNPSTGDWDKGGLNQGGILGLAEGAAAVGAPFALGALMAPAAAPAVTGSLATSTPAWAANGALSGLAAPSAAAPSAGALAGGAGAGLGSAATPLSTTAAFSPTGTAGNGLLPTSTKLGVQAAARSGTAIPSAVTGGAKGAAGLFGLSPNTWNMIAGVGQGVASGLGQRAAGNDARQASELQSAVQESALNPYRAANAQTRSMRDLDQSLHGTPMSFDPMAGRYGTVTPRSYTPSPEMMAWMAEMQRRIATGQAMNPQIAPLAKQTPQNLGGGNSASIVPRTTQRYP